MKFNKILILLVLIPVFILIFIWQSRVSSQENQSNNQIQEEVKEESKFNITKVDIVEGSTFGVLMSESGIAPTVANSIFSASQDVYDLSKIRIGRSIDLFFDKTTNELEQLVYQIDTEEELFVTRQSTPSSTDKWLAEKIPIDYEVKIKTSQGEVKTSLYEAALDQGIDERAIIDFANIFQWSVDFALSVRVGDTFNFIYEERYRNGEYIMPGKILAANYVNDNSSYYAFYYAESDENTGYFDQDGNSVQKMFLKAPVAYKYISSGFTTGSRYVQAFNVSTGHRAIDYAATYGTPIRSVADGTVTTAGWNGPYGNFVSIRHNGTYSTNYAHMSKIAVRYGQRVKQGDTIGYVGSTGFSTGPHVHYEMVKNGVKINPLLEVLPPGEEIKTENQENFLNSIRDYASQLGLNI